jgi:hypothetical protein
MRLLNSLAQNYQELISTCYPSVAECSITLKASEPMFSDDYIDILSNIDEGFKQQLEQIARINETPELLRRPANG